MESAGGLVLMAGAALALVAANSPLADYYDLFIETPVEVRIGRLEIAKPLLLWVNDGLMAVFFFLVGLEVKREILEGECEVTDLELGVDDAVTRYVLNSSTISIDLKKYFIDSIF